MSTLPMLILQNDDDLERIFFEATKPWIIGFMPRKDTASSHALYHVSIQLKNNVNKPEKPHRRPNLLTP